MDRCSRGDVLVAAPESAEASTKPARAAQTEGRESLRAASSHKIVGSWDRADNRVGVPAHARLFIRLVLCKKGLMTARTLGLLLAVVFAALSALHVFWAAGGRWGAAVAVPRRASPSDVKAADRPLFTPRPAGTLLVALLLAAAAGLVLAQGGTVRLPLGAALLRNATLLLGAVLVARAVGDFRYVGLFKSVRSSDFARYDTLFFTPLCLALGAGALWLGWARRD